MQLSLGAGLQEGLSLPVKMGLPASPGSLRELCHPEM